MDVIEKKRKEEREKGGEIPTVRTPLVRINPVVVSLPFNNSLVIINRSVTRPQQRWDVEIAATP